METPTTEGTFTMPHTPRRLLTGLLLAAAGLAALAAAPGAANAAGVSATVHVTGTLKMRASAALSAPITGAVRDLQKVTVACVTPGTTVRGSVRTSGLWARLATERYVPYAYVRAVRAVPRCAADGAQALPVKTKPSVTYQTGTVRSADGKVNLRTGPSTSSEIKGSLATGQRVNLVCGVVGEPVSGTVRSTNQWNRTTTGLYLSHAYVSTSTLTLCKDAPSITPSPSPSMTTEQFIAAAVPGAQQGWRQYGVPPSVTIAQAILESGWGRSGLSMTHKNYFGIKCQNGRFGTLASGCYTYRTNECTKAGNCFTTTGSFRTYATMAHSFRDHGNFLRVNSRYKPAFGYTRNANKFIWTVWKAGYATDPNYYTKITGLMSSHELYKYDTWK
ncbi:MAG TPA: sporangiospore maturation cell wall hydrolase GsmA [Actinoplanes sp.]|nr:sporangiospore maturation cell wall hydrolase GsmA [Actinoplanes sp.]